MDSGHEGVSDAVARALAGPPPRAGSFIVTIYGDVVEPRGGTLWMGTLIEVCADHGISEGLVRTAVSRLVASGRLAGDRRGRRSYYRLTPEARAEFTDAARVLFAPAPVARGWLIRFGDDEFTPDFRSAGWAVAAGYSVAPDRDDLPRPGGLLLSSSCVSGEEGLRDFAARHWDLGPLDLAYRDFVATFRPLAEGDQASLDGGTALSLRLRLVHEYRRILLADPRLPAGALPEDWPGAEARRTFASLYQALAESADRQVGISFRDAEGLLPSATPATAARLRELAKKISA